MGDQNSIAYYVQCGTTYNGTVMNHSPGAKTKTRQAVGDRHLAPTPAMPDLPALTWVQGVEIAFFSITSCTLSRPRGYSCATTAESRDRARNEQCGGGDELATVHGTCADMPDDRRCDGAAAIFANCRSHRQWSGQ